MGVHKFNNSRWETLSVYNNHAPIYHLVYYIGFTFAKKKDENYVNNAKTRASASFSRLIYANINLGRGPREMRQ